jgi:DNA-binding transcriptional ArsR family regulator
MVRNHYKGKYVDYQVRCVLWRRRKKIFSCLRLKKVYIKLLNMKKNTCSDVLEEYSRRLKACGHPLRLQLLFAIEKGENACVKELWKSLKQVQPVVSQHLAILKEQGIVKCKTVRNKRVYTITDPFIKEIIRLLSRDEALKGASFTQEKE